MEVKAGGKKSEVVKHFRNNKSQVSAWIKNKDKINIRPARKYNDLYKELRKRFVTARKFVANFIKRT